VPEILKTEGIFRLSGSVTLINELKTNVDKGNAVDLASVNDPHAVAGLLKMFLRELPEPLCTFELHEKFLEIQRFHSEDMLEKSKHLLNSLPSDHRTLFLELLSLLLKVSSYSEFNKMTSQNLAIVFGPNIFRGRDESAFAAIENSQSVNELTTFLIEHAQYLTQ